MELNYKVATRRSGGRMVRAFAPAALRGTLWGLWVRVPSSLDRAALPTTGVSVTVVVAWTQELYISMTEYTGTWADIDQRADAL